MQGMHENQQKRLHMLKMARVVCIGMAAFPQTRADRKGTEGEQVKLHIKELRKGKGLTQQQLADMLGWKLRRLQSYENMTRWPKTIDLCELCVALSCQLNDLIH